MRCRRPRGRQSTSFQDGTCRTCENIARAVLVQFGDIDVQIIKRAYVRRPETVRG